MNRLVKRVMNAISSTVAFVNISTHISHVNSVVNDVIFAAMFTQYQPTLGTILT